MTFKTKARIPMVKNYRSIVKYSIYEIGFFSNPFIYPGITVALIAQAAFVYSPFMNRWFYASPLNAEAWVWSAAVALSILIIIGIEKWIRKKYFTKEKL